MTGEMIIRNHFNIISNPCELVECTIKVVWVFELMVIKKDLLLVFFVFFYSWELVTGLLLERGSWLRAEDSLLVSSCLFHDCLLGHHFGWGRGDKLLAVMLLWASSRTVWSCFQWLRQTMTTEPYSLCSLWSIFRRNKRVGCRQVCWKLPSCDHFVLVIILS